MTITTRATAPDRADISDGKPAKPRAAPPRTSADRVKILIIEDDSATGNYIADGLREEGHCVDLVANGSDGLLQATVGTYDAMVVDRIAGP